MMNQNNTQQLNGLQMADSTFLKVGSALSGPRHQLGWTSHYGAFRTAAHFLARAGRESGQALRRAVISRLAS